MVAVSADSMLVPLVSLLASPGNNKSQSIRPHKSVTAEGLTHGEHFVAKQIQLSLRAKLLKRLLEHNSKGRTGNGRPQMH